MRDPAEGSAVVTEADESLVNRSSQFGVARIAIGLFQGIALYALFNAAQSEVWPVTNAPLFASLSIVFVFVPLLVVAGLGYLRFRLLCGWTLTVGLICVGLGWYDIIRDPAVAPTTSRFLALPPLWLTLAAGLFIAQSLLVAGAADRRLIARYATYFDVSWKYGLQLALATLFAGVFWLLLWLGAELFRLIEIDFVIRIIEKAWFSIPATTLVLACAFHITDVSVGVVRGVRILSCNLLSWLLPLMTAITLVFLVALLFTGMDPLWYTKRASLILLAAAACLIFLINSAYQDGRNIDTGSAQPMSRVLRTAMRVASAVLLPLVLLAAYGIALRIGQYGWTPERVFATACTIIVACYTSGYVIAAARPRLFAVIETTNVAAAFFVLAILLALFSPIADPARVSVANQLHRLQIGQITPEQFDYAFLRFDAGRFGINALHELAGQKTLTVAAAKAASALQKQTRYEVWKLTGNLTAREIAANINVAQPPGRVLPPEFLAKDWSKYTRDYQLPTCMKSQNKCDAIFTDLDGDGTEEIILLSAAESRAVVFRRNGDNSWDVFGKLENVSCPGIHGALIAGQFAIVPPIVRELEVNGQRLRMVWTSQCN